VYYRKFDETGQQNCLSKYYNKGKRQGENIEFAELKVRIFCFLSPKSKQTPFPAFWMIVFAPK
jgi:hypothetical protein